jgi:CRISPR system Cascade subunit CasD
MANTLFLRLEGPLQAWGEGSQWSERRTAPEPTKSGIVGLLACGLGWDDDERIANLSRRIRIGVRCDVPGTSAPLRDYHTVGGGYRTPQLLTAVGKPKLSGGKPHTEPTWRYYLCDASFLAAVQSVDHQSIDDLAKAVQNPHWPIFLGRKCCVPARPPFDGVGDYASLEEALTQHPALFFKDEVRFIETMPRVVVECRAGEGVRRRDQLVSRTYRLFEPRYSREGRLSQQLRIKPLDAGG